MMTWVWSVTNTSIEPPVPAATCAPFAMMAPVGEFRIDVIGVGGLPVGQADRYVSVVVGTTVKFSE
jgi:hypothetical protein